MIWNRGLDLSQLLLFFEIEKEIDEFCQALLYTFT